MRESVIEKAVVKHATQQGWWCLKLHIINHAGFPDRLCLGNNAQIKFLEFKATNKKPRKLQMWVINKLKNMGFDVHVIDSTKAGRYVFQN